MRELLVKALATRRALAETGHADDWKQEIRECVNLQLSALPLLHQAAQ